MRRIDVAPHSFETDSRTLDLTNYFEVHLNRNGALILPLPNSFGLLAHPDRPQLFIPHQAPIRSKYKIKMDSALFNKNPSLLQTRRSKRDLASCNKSIESPRDELRMLRAQEKKGGSPIEELKQEREEEKEQRSHSSNLDDHTGSSLPVKPFTRHESRVPTSLPPQMLRRSDVKSVAPNTTRRAFTLIPGKSQKSLRKLTRGLHSLQPSKLPSFKRKPGRRAEHETQTVQHVTA